MLVRPLPTIATVDSLLSDPKIVQKRGVNACVEMRSAWLEDHPEAK